MGSKLLRGVTAGIAATGAMSAVMVAGDKAGLMPQQPPKSVVRKLVPGRPKHGVGGLAAAAHIGFGAASGALLSVLSRGRPVPAAVGAGYGLAIWLASYQGWIPAIGALPPASRDPALGRVAVMATAHVVFGVTLARALSR